MSAHVYHEIYLHVNWHTKDDRPMLTGRPSSACAKRSAGAARLTDRLKAPIEKPG